ncbi:MAG: Asp-tRNA(Asn)/Glu-tRNA(Gln) amidotransferase subunit GatB [Clostridia bacterium]|nr:Asp-tRNA(Asn)/Glu-tRNA(Gln) amidotransferase subunit GatB [Clostridia bacterium]
MNYETVIGLEVHSELATASKAFCSCENKFGGEPNTHCCPVCSGMPGVLPVLNKKVVEFCIKAGLATNCSITRYGKQDRKNYFYPDLPKAYQISQYDLPICHSGYIDIKMDGYTRRVRITRIHIEEDAGKLVHSEFGSSTLVDYNRCGVPLIEIVTEPDIRSSAEAYVFLETLRNILMYIEVSDCKMQEGSLRCDVNLSVRPEGSAEYGTRCEMKNVNSFSAAVRAMDYERVRQIELLSSGEEVSQETRRWDDEKGMSALMRTKEDAQDYRYFPDPDLCAIVIDDEWVESIRSTLPELPEQKKERYMGELSLSEYDAEFICAKKALAALFDDARAAGASAKAAANWIMSDISKILNDSETEPEDSPFGGKELAELISLIDKGTISGSIAKKVLKKMFDNPQKSPAQIVEESGMVQISDEGAIREIVLKVLNDNPKSVEDYKNGKKAAMGFLVGQTMRALRGQGNPQLINKLLSEELDK